MPSITLSTGQVSDPIEVGPGTRVTAVGGYVQWTTGSMVDARNGVATWQNWPAGAVAATEDTLRRVVIRAVATGAMTLTWDESRKDEGADGVYWQEQIPSWATDANGNAVGMVGPDGRIRTLAPMTSTTLVSVAVLGDSIARNNYTPSNRSGLVGNIRLMTSFGSWAAFAAYTSGGLAYFDPYACEGYSGQQTHEILASTQAASATETYGVAETIAIGIANRKPGIVFEISGTNDMIFAQAADISSGAALRRAIAGRRALWAYIRSWGGRPIAVSLMPRQGTFVATGGALSQNALKPRTAEWNAAMQAAAAADGVDWLDAYSVTAAADGGWLPGYIIQDNADDTFGIHPSYLASLAIGRLGGQLLQRIIVGAPVVPRLELGQSALYSAAFVANSRRQAFANFGDGMLPSTTGWATRFDADGDSSFGMFTPTQDVAGGGTIRFVKPANAGGRYADWAGPTLAVTAGQEYVMFADVRARQIDSFAMCEIHVVDRTAASPSAFQPLGGVTIQRRRAPDGATVDSGLMRVAIPYRVQTGINSVSPLVSFNRVSGGGATGQDEIYISNIGQLRIA